MSMEECMEAIDLLELIPQQRPFRFIDQIISVNENQIQTSYRFKEDEYFYQGHFPNNPVTPGVILTEAAAQASVVALGIYLLDKMTEKKEELKKWTTFFTESQMEFFLPVYPGTNVRIVGEKIFWRKMKLKSKVQMFNDQNELVCEGILAGVGVKNEK